MKTILKLSTAILLFTVCILSIANAQQRKNFIISECIVEKNISAFSKNFTETERGYVNEIKDLFIGESIQVIQLDPVTTNYQSSQLPNYKFNLLGYTFTLQYSPLDRNYKKFKSSEFLLSNMNWNKTEPQRYKSNFTLKVKEDHEELGQIIITLIAVLDTGD